MKNINIFCFGFGQVAKSFIKKINFEGYKVNLSTTSRDTSSERNFNGITYQSYQFDEKKFDEKLLVNLKNADHILVSIPPKDNKDLVLENFSKYIQNEKVKWLTYLSATSVYGDHKGEWVNEDSKMNTTSLSGQARITAENSWLSLNVKKNLPVQIFRLSGIYSNENNILVRLKSKNINLVNKKNHYFSRIHVDDISNLLFESLFKFKSGEIYNLSDDKPTPLNEIILYGAKLLKIKHVKTIDVDEIESEMLKNFYKDSKKVSNEKIKKFFNYYLKFPTYVEGLDHIKNDLI